MATKKPEPEPKIVQLLAATPLSGGDDSVPHGRGRSSVTAWGLLEDGTVVALVREGGALVRSAAADPEELVAPIGPVDVPTEPEPETDENEADAELVAAEPTA